MRVSLLLIVSLMSLAAQGAGENRDAAKSGSPAKTDAAPARDPGKIEIPAGAVRSEDGGYRYTDAKGKKWIFRKTPFGVSRVEDKAVDGKPEAKAADVPPSLKVIEDGDTLRFERPGPFGTYKWQRKKSELDEMEQAAWDREKARAAKQD